MTEPGTPAEPRELVGRLAQQAAASALDPDWPVPSWFYRSWDVISDKAREFFMAWGSAVFAAGRRAGDEAAVLELTHQANVWEEFAEEAWRRHTSGENQPLPDGTELPANVPPPVVLHWGDRAVAYGKVAQELRTRVDELTGKRPARKRLTPSTDAVEGVPDPDQPSLFQPDITPPGTPYLGPEKVHR